MIDLGTVTGFTIPGTTTSAFHDASYLDSGIFPNDIHTSIEDLQNQIYFHPTSGYTGFTFLGIGASRIAEKKKSEKVSRLKVKYIFYISGSNRKSVK